MIDLNVNYAIADQGSGQRYPALQVSDYEPRFTTDQPVFVLAEDSLEMLASEPKAWIASAGTIECAYRQGQVTMFKLPTDTRFVVCGIPRVMKQNKSTKEISPIQKGDTFARSGFVTATRLPLCLVAGGEILLRSDGTPQLFTLKLTSNKCNLVNGDRNDPEFRSLRALNDELLKHYKQRKAILTHLVSVNLVVKPRTFVSKGTGQSSTAVIFELDGNARPLPESMQRLMYHFVQTEEVREFLADPFGISSFRKDSFVSAEEDFMSAPDAGHDAIPF